LASFSESSRIRQKFLHILEEKTPTKSKKIIKKCSAEKLIQDGRLIQDDYQN
jgi:hypothetical protein